MIAESIKKLLGEELTQKVEEALKGKGKDGKDIDIVVGNDGSYVPAVKHDEVKGQASSAEAALKAAAEALKAIGGSGDPTKIATDVETAKTTIADLQTKHKNEMAKIQKTTALKLALSDSVYDPEDIISRLELDKIEVDDNGSLKTKVDDLIKPIKESKPYLFKETPKPHETAPPTIKGAIPAEPGKPDPNQNAGLDEVRALMGLK